MDCETCKQMAELTRRIEALEGDVDSKPPPAVAEAISVLKASNEKNETHPLWGGIVGILLIVACSAIGTVIGIHTFRALEERYGATPVPVRLEIHEAAS